MPTASLISRSGALALLALAACAPRPASTPAPEPTTAPPVPAPADAAPTTPSSTPGSFVAASMAPRTRAPEPTVPAITANDLRTRLYIVANDSMLGREAGEPGNVKVTDYIAGQLRSMGLEPAGEDGTYFQRVPLVQRALDTGATVLAVGDSTIPVGADLLPLPPHTELGFGATVNVTGAPVVYGGALGDSTATLPRSRAAGRIVVLSAPPGPSGFPDIRTGTLGRLPSRFPGAAAFALSLSAAVPQQLVGYATRSQTMLPGESDTSAAPVVLLVSPRAARLLLGAAPESLSAGATGERARLRVAVSDSPTPQPARNVIAVLPGSDPALRGQYVAIGAHSDHVGIAPRAVNHDSLRAARRIMGEDPGSPPSDAQRAAIQALTDSLTRAHGGVRADSIFNGADDDGSGTVTVLEIAQALSSAPTAPRRSTLFVWHTGEEGGMLGSTYFTDNPTVPRDSIVTQLNMDMVGRGAAGDIPGGGPGYLQLVGSRRLSTQLGDLVEAENAQDNHGFTFDYTYDAPGQPENIYCRSDHYSYARYGIPIVFFTTGLHQDYHQVTDEPQYIDYDHMANVAKLVKDIAVRVGNLDQRPVVDKPKPDPNGVCKQ